MPLEMDNIVDISVQNIDNFVLIKKILSIIFYFDTIDIQCTLWYESIEVVFDVLWIALKNGY